MPKELPTKAEIERQIKSYNVGRAEAELIRRGLTEKGVPEKIFKKMKKAMKYRPAFEGGSVLKDRFGNSWTEVGAMGDGAIGGGRWRISRKDHLQEQIDRLYKETGQLPKGVRKLERKGALEDLM